MFVFSSFCFFFFFFNDTATTEIYTLSLHDALPIRAFVPITAGALGMPPLRFYAVNIVAILLWAPAHIVPGVLAVSALDRAGGLAGLGGTAKHYWIPLVIGGALIVALAT